MHNINIALGILALIIGIGIWITGRSDLLSYLSLIAGGAIIFSSFLIIVRQYERAVVLRLGRYRRQVGPGIQKRIPFADNVLVVDIRERVSEFKAVFDAANGNCISLKKRFILLR